MFVFLRVRRWFVRPERQLTEVVRDMQQLGGMVDQYATHPEYIVCLSIIVKANSLLYRVNSLWLNLRRWNFDGMYEKHLASLVNCARCLNKLVQEFSNHLPKESR